MNSKKVIAIILGVLMVIAGIRSVSIPDATYMGIIWILGLCIAFDAAGGILSWSEKHKFGAANGWDLTASVISLIFGLFLIFSNWFKFATGTALLYVGASWLTLVGIFRIINAVRLYRLRSAYGLEVIGKSWGWALLMGVLMTAVGIFCLVSPKILAAAIGMAIGIAIIVAGLFIIGFALLFRRNA